MIHQLRVYELFEHNKDAFHQRFRDHATRIMRRHGFKFIGMWDATTNRRREFVCLIEWPDEATKDAAWEAFRSDPEWIAIREKTRAAHGPLFGDIDDRILRLSEYSPKFGP